MENVVSKPELRTIQRILIANRGEIAMRVIRTARKMGILSIAVYADSDSDAPFVRAADIAIALEGNTSAETYLNQNKLLAACKSTNADAVHPGYGFLSENADFARAVKAAGVAWIGPSADSIIAMGDKLSAKKIMQNAGVPTLAAKKLNAGDDIHAAAQEIGFPVLVKASAGGGGKGMRVVENEADLESAVLSAQREAGKSFGDDTVFLERWLSTSRHVEIQILGDQHGNLVHCFERECSIQRRHQKVIEEAPSTAVNERLRSAMSEAALSAARKIGYFSTGTVEFLVDGDEFWFLEVNTRLQVEHPITEEITGLDLVREQIRVAEGETLEFSQTDLSIKGHAIEARLYAEDPARQFLPSPGRVALWKPANAPGVRFDTGIETGSEIGIDFDPMLAKVIVHAPSRKEAIRRLANALEQTRIEGLITNRDFLVACLRTPEFLAGDTTTDFIERVAPALTRMPSKDEITESVIAACLASQYGRRNGAEVLADIGSGWRNSVMPPQRIEFACNCNGTENAYLVEYRCRRDCLFTVQIASQEFVCEVHSCTNLPTESGSNVAIDLSISGKRCVYELLLDGDTWYAQSPMGNVRLRQQARFPSTVNEEVGGGLMAPMPGNVLAVMVEVGDVVEKGQTLLILEAMKMEHPVQATIDGVISEINVAVGEQVDNNQSLIVLTELSEGKTE